MTTRRGVLGLGISALLPAMARAQAQAAKKPLRVAWFSGGTLEDQKIYVDAFRGGMRELGYSEGRDYQIQYFWRGETIKPFTWIAKDIVDSHPDVVMATCEVTVGAMQKVTSTTPIVMTASTDPVASGVVKSLARPGGNVTGIASKFVEVSVKRIDLLKELVPHAERIAFVRWRYEAMGDAEQKALEDAARRVGTSFKIYSAEDERDFQRVYADMQRERIAGAVDLAGLAISFPFMALLPELCARYKVPTIHYIHELVERGGLISYGPSVAEGFKLSAKYVDRLAKGARAGDLPIDQPTQIETWVNLRTARAIGVTVPQSILLRADRVIE
jgi:putative ABC transport system substrate-binding protein